MQPLRAGCIVKQTHKQTNTKTDRGDYNTLRSLASNVNITLLKWRKYRYTTW